MLLAEPELILIRTSTLLSEYIRKHLDMINSPIQLNVSSNIEQMTSEWDEEEKEAGRRLVNLVVARESFASFRITAHRISPHSYTPGDRRLIISCIKWDERERYVVTSVDMILVLEYLVGEQFSIEEKSRIRRNLQFLKPSTITRSNNESKRLFNSLMAMENPRPRNIEKDLKVFEWSELFVAVKKVLSKYSANPGASEVLIQPTAPMSKLISDTPMAASGKPYPLRVHAPNIPIENTGSAPQHTGSSASSTQPSIGLQQPSAPLSVNPFIDLPQHFIGGANSKGGSGSPRPIQKLAQVERSDARSSHRCNVPQGARPIQSQTIQA